MGLSLSRLRKEIRHALDNICDTAGSVVVGSGQRLHLRWFHPISLLVLALVLVFNLLSGRQAAL